MEFYKDLYVGETARKKKHKIIKKLKTNAGQLNTYIITLPINSEAGLLEIYHSAVIMQQYYQKQSFVVVGIAIGYEEALSVVIRIIDEVFKVTGDLDVRSYFRLIGNMC